MTPDVTTWTSLGLVLITYDVVVVFVFAIIAWGSLDIGIETYDNALFQAFSRNYIVTVYTVNGIALNSNILAPKCFTHSAIYLVDGRSIVNEYFGIWVDSQPREELNLAQLVASETIEHVAAEHLCITYGKACFLKVRMWKSRKSN